MLTRLIFFLVASFNFGLGQKILAQSFFRPQRGEVILKQRRSAIVKISMIDQRGENVAHGSGFFVNNQGLMITNFHVLSYLQFPQKSWFYIKNASGEEYTKAYIVSCSDERNIDLCLLWLPEHLERHGHYFELWPHKVPTGHRIYKIGNGHGEFHLAEGITLKRDVQVNFMLGGHYRENRHVDFIEISVPIFPGDSGGPVFDQFGQVIGMNTLKIFAPGEVRKYALSSQEIAKHIPQHWPLQKNLPQLALLDREGVKEVKDQYRKKYGPPDGIPLGKVVDTVTVRQLIEQKSALIVDVRDGSHYLRGHLPGAYSLPYKELSQPKRDFLMAKDQFNLEALRGLLQQNPNKKLLLYGQDTGSWQSYKAAETARIKGGLENILWYREGYDAWESYIDKSRGESESDSTQRPPQKAPPLPPRN